MVLSMKVSVMRMTIAKIYIQNNFVGVVVVYAGTLAISERLAKSQVTALSSRFPSDQIGGPP